MTRSDSEALQRLLRENLKNCAHVSAAYHVGSAVSHPETSRDFDVLVMAPDTAGLASAESDLRALANAIKTPAVIPHSFDASTASLRCAVDEVVVGFESVSGAVPDVRYAVGPTTGHTSDHTVCLHVCGPLQRRDWHLFAELLPGHAAVFRGVNVTLLGGDIEDWLPGCDPGIEDWRQEAMAHLDRAKVAASVEAVQKAAKRALLCAAFATPSQDPYGLVMSWLDGVAVHRAADLRQVVCDATAMYWGGRSSSALAARAGSSGKR